MDIPTFMDVAGQHILADARFTLDQNRRVHMGKPFAETQQIFHDRTDCKQFFLASAGFFRLTQA